MIRLQRSRLIGRLLIAVVALSMSPNLYSQHQTESGAPAKSTLAKIAGFLDQSGYTYTKVRENVWTIAFTGKAFSNFNVRIASNESILVMSVLVVEKKKNLKGNIQEMMYKLLKFNIDADFVKMGIDDDENLIVRADLTTRTLDLQEFKDVVEQMAAAANEIYTTVRPYMNAP